MGRFSRSPCECSAALCTKYRPSSSGQHYALPLSVVSQQGVSGILGRAVLPCVGLPYSVRGVAPPWALASGSVPVGPRHPHAFQRGPGGGGTTAS